MARSRGIKPGFFRNADLVELPMESRLLFIGLWTLADREGRLEDRPKQIKMEIFPADNMDCDALLSGLAATGMLARYEVGGKRYLQVTNFTKHQNPHRDEKTSTIPDSCGNLATKDAALNKHGANTVQAPCIDDADTMPIRLTPDSGLLTPDSRLLTPDTPTREDAGEQPPPDDESPVRVSLPGSICMAMRAVGMVSVNPGHPELLGLIEKGADIGMFVGAAQSAVKKNKGFAYALGSVAGQMRDAAALAATPLAVPIARPQQAESFAAQDQRMKRRAWEEMTGESWPADDGGGRVAGLVIDINEPAPQANKNMRIA